MHLGHDLRLVLRGFRQTPASPVLIVLTLGLAIGANSAIFSLIDRVALRPLPVEKPYEIVIVTAEQLPFPCPCLSTGGGKMKGMPYPLFQSVHAGLSRSFSAMGAFHMISGLTMAAEPSAIEIYGESVTADFFKVLGLHALLGRTLLPSDEGQRDPPSPAVDTGGLRRGLAVAGPGSGRPAEAGGPAIAVLNHGFWMRQFGGDRSILNRTIRLNNVPFTVVGVLAPGYSGMVPGYRPDVFVPVAMGGQLMPAGLRAVAWAAWDSPTVSLHHVIARLAPGVTREAAERELRVYYQRLWDEVVRTRNVTLTAKDMDVYRRHPPEVIAAGTVGSTQSAPQRNLEAALRLLFGMTVFVLLVAAGNVANLLAASGARRGHETAVSLALGARRWDLLRPRLVEALTLAVVSGGAALLLAEWTGNLAPSLLGVREDLAGIDTRPDARVVVFTAAMSILTGLLIWLASALLVTRRAGLPSLVAGRADATGRRPGATVRRGLVVVQVALSFALVCTAVLFGRSLANVLSVDPGFDADHVVGFTVNPRAVGYDGDRLESYVNALVDRAGALPGVLRVAVSSEMPLSGDGCCSEVTGPRQQAGHAATQYAAFVHVSPDYFATIGLGLVTGRTFDDHDVRTAPRVVIANEAAVRLLVDSPEVLGQRIGSPGAPARQEIVGVVRDGRSGLKTPAEPTLYLPRAQESGGGPISVLLRVPRADTVSAAAVTDIVKRLDRGVALTAFGSLGTLARDALLRDRMLAGLSQVFAALAGLLAAIGLAGLTSVNVTRRTREIGVRLALGASRGSVQRLMLREVAVLIGCGTAIGVALFLSANRLLASMLFGISPGDPATIASAIAALAIVGLLAGLLPARRAAHVDPAVTLRCE